MRAVASSAIAAWQAATKSFTASASRTRPCWPYGRTTWPSDGRLIWRVDSEPSRLGKVIDIHAAGERVDIRVFVAFRLIKRVPTREHHRRPAQKLGLVLFQGCRSVRKRAELVHTVEHNG